MNRDKKSTGVEGRPPSQRQLRVGEILRHELAQFFQRETVNAPELENANISVTEVRIDASLRHAKVYIMPLGGENLDAVVAACNQHAKQIRKIVVQGLHLKYAPEIKFAADRSFDEAASIDALLESDKVRKDLSQ